MQPVDCSICLNKLPDTTPVLLESREKLEQTATDAKVQLLCGHYFHQHCLFDQLKPDSLDNPNLQLCANCRAPISFVPQLTEQEREGALENREAQRWDEAVTKITEVLEFSVDPENPTDQKEKANKIGHLLRGLLRVDTEMFPRMKVTYSLQQGVLEKFQIKNQIATTPPTVTQPPPGLSELLSFVRERIPAFAEDTFDDPTLFTSDISDLLAALYPQERELEDAEVTFDSATNTITAIQVLAALPDEGEPWIENAIAQMREQAELRETAADKIATALSLPKTANIEKAETEQKIGHLIRGMLGIDTTAYPGMQCNFNLQGNELSKLKLENLSQGNEGITSTPPDSLPALLEDVGQLYPDLVEDNPSRPILEKRISRLADILFLLFSDKDCREFHSTVVEDGVGGISSIAFERYTDESSEEAGERQ